MKRYATILWLPLFAAFTYACPASAQELSYRHYHALARFYDRPHGLMTGMGTPQAFAVSPQLANKNQYFHSDSRLKLNWKFTPERFRKQYGLQLTDRAAQPMIQQAARLQTVEAITRTIRAFGFGNLSLDAIKYLKNQRDELPRFHRKLKEVLEIVRRNGPTAADDLYESIAEDQRTVAESISASLISGVLNNARQEAYDHWLADALESDVADIRSNFWNQFGKIVTSQPKLNARDAYSFDYSSMFISGQTLPTLDIRENKGQNLSNVIVFLCMGQTGKANAVRVKNWEPNGVATIALPEVVTALPSEDRKASSLRVVIAAANGLIINQVLSQRPGFRLVSMPAKPKRSRAKTNLDRSIERITQSIKKPERMRGMIVFDPFPIPQTDRQILAKLAATKKQDQQARAQLNKSIRAALVIASKYQKTMSEAEREQLEQCRDQFAKKQIPVDLIPLVNKQLLAAPPSRNRRVASKPLQGLSDTTELYVFLSQSIVTTKASGYQTLSALLSDYAEQVRKTPPLDTPPVSEALTGYKTEDPGPVLQCQAHAEKFIQIFERRIGIAEKSTWKKLEAARTDEAKQDLEEQFTRLRERQAYPKWCKKREHEYFQKLHASYMNALDRIPNNDTDVATAKENSIKKIQYVMRELHPTHNP